MTKTIEQRRLAMVYLLLGWCAVLIGIRLYLGTDGLAIGLMWNLFLAAVPLLWSAAFTWATDKRNPVLGLTFFGLWLLFLPNAPYLLTDMIHLSPRPGVPEWYILAMLLSCAGTGTILGYLSIMSIQRDIEQIFNKTVGWLVAGGSLMLCGFGIYIGRFLRWNSWNAFNRPLEVVEDVLRQMTDTGPHPNPIAVTLVFGTGLIIGYLALRVMSHEP